MKTAEQTRLLYTLVTAVMATARIALTDVTPGQFSDDVTPMTSYQGWQGGGGDAARRREILVGDDQRSPSVLTSIVNVTLDALLTSSPQELTVGDVTGHGGLRVAGVVDVVEANGSTASPLDMSSFYSPAPMSAYSSPSPTDAECEAILADVAGPPPDYSEGVRWAVLGLLMLVPLMTIAGNFVTILAVLTHRKLRTKTNAFIVSLAIADMCVSLLVMPFGIYQHMTSGVWRLGGVLCSLSSSLDVMMCTVSIFHLSCLAIDRYLAICRPFLHERLKTYHVVLMLAGCWIVPVFISFLPIMNGWNELGIEDYIACAFPPEVEACAFVVNVPFAVVCSLIAFYIPVVFMGVCNAKIYVVDSKQAHQIRSLEAAGHHCHVTSHKKRKFHHETKAAKTLSIIMGCFSVCWFPFFILNVIDPVVGYRVPYVPWMVALWLGYLNSAMNPLLYFFFNRHFNHAFRRLLRCRVCKGVRDYDEEMMTGITSTSE